jgi:8-oxo-dGTP diphosphatase
MAGERDSVLHVAAAVVVNDAAQVLVARRPPDRHQGGLWEFPGGKVEAGETPHAALVRELREELGIGMEKARPLIRVRHSYSDISVLLDVWRVASFTGEPHGREGQPIAWVAPDELSRRDFPAANRPIVTAARLPSLYLITPEPDNASAFLNRLETLLAAGIELVQLRAKAMEPAAYKKLARHAVVLCAEAKARLLLNAPPSLAEEVGAAGVHLTSARLMALDERPLNREQWVAASCHDQRELEHACRIGVDFAVVAPVLKTASHPAATPLGWGGLRQIAEQAGVPVYALGGMAMEHLTTAWGQGAQGIASVSALWNAEDARELIARAVSA